MKRRAFQQGRDFLSENPMEQLRFFPGADRLWKAQPRNNAALFQGVAILGIKLKPGVKALGEERFILKPSRIELKSEKETELEKPYLDYKGRITNDSSGHAVAVTPFASAKAAPEPPPARPFQAEQEGATGMPLNRALYGLNEEMKNI